MELKWYKYGNYWGDLRSMDLSHPHFNDMEGVYIIWSGGSTVRVGQGIVKNRLHEHRNNPQIVRHSNLLVTWAFVPAHQRDGVERFLANRLNPVVGDAFPNAMPIQVNLPW